MAILIINNKVFNYPDPGSQPGAGDSAIGYGEDATAWAKEVTSVINSLLGRGDILTTTVTIQDNVSSFQDIQFMVFSGSIVRSANISYVVERADGNNSYVESGTIYLNYNEDMGIWSLAQKKQGDAGVVFSITSEGQVQYKSSDLPGPDYTGSITFQAKTLGQ